MVQIALESRPFGIPLVGDELDVRQFDADALGVELDEEGY